MKNRLYKKVLTWSFAMIILGLLQGLYSREILRPVEGTVDPLTVQLVKTSLFLEHGHFILLGGLLPLGLLFAAGVLKDGLEEKQYVLLNRAFLLLMIGTAMSLALAVYKNSAIVFFLMKEPGEDLYSLSRKLFGGNTVIRSALYGLSHTVVSAGVLWFIVILWKKIKLIIK